MSKSLPVKNLLKLIREVQDTMAEHPESDVTFILRGSYESDGEGEVAVRADLDVPPVIAAGVDAKASGGISRHWKSLGSGEFVFFISRPGTISARMLETSRGPFQDLSPGPGVPES